jgi:hypothetical protein
VAEAGFRGPRALSAFVSSGTRPDLARIWCSPSTTDRLISVMCPMNSRTSTSWCSRDALFRFAQIDDDSADAAVKEALRIGAVGAALHEDWRGYGPVCGFASHRNRMAPRAIACDRPEEVKLGLADPTITNCRTKGTPKAT